MDLLARPNSLCSTAFACSPGAGLALAATMMLGPGCAEPPVHDRPSPTGRIEQLAADLQQDNPWPEIREERIRLLLPQAMEAAGVDSWIVLSRRSDQHRRRHQSLRHLVHRRAALRLCLDGRRDGAARAHPARLGFRQGEQP